MPRLQRALGIFQLTLAGVGMLVGAGIYVLIGSVAGVSGNALWISFLIAAFLSLLTALSYAELSSIYSRSGAEFDYVRNNLGKALGFVVLMFMFFAGIVSIATVSLGFASYLSAFFNIHIPFFLFSIFAVALFSLISIKGIKESSWTNIILTIIEVSGLLFVIFIGIPFFGKVNYLQLPPNANLFAVFSGAAIIFFAFQGIGGLVKFADEAKNPKKTIPLAIVLTIVISAILYLLVALSAVSVAGWQVLSTSKAPLSEIANVVLGSKAFFIFSIIALLSTANTILLNLVANSNLLYDISLNSKKLSFFSKVHKSFRTPIRAIIFVAVAAFLFTLFGSLSFVAELANFSLFIIYFLVNSSLIYYRVKRKPRAGFRIPFNVKNVPLTAVLGCITSAVMMFSLQKEVLSLGMIFIAIVYALYISIFKEKKN